MSSNHSGNSVPSITQEEHTHPFGTNAFGAKMVVEPIPAAFFSEKRMDYQARTDGQPVYVGYNLPGSLTSATNWALQKITYDGSDNPTRVEVAVSSWDNRTSAF